MIVGWHLAKCDACGRPGPLDGREWWPTAGTARNAALKVGWFRVPRHLAAPRGRDLCPACAEADGWGVSTRASGLCAVVSGEEVEGGVVREGVGGVEGAAA